MEPCCLLDAQSALWRDILLIFRCSTFWYANEIRHPKRGCNQPQTPEIFGFGWCFSKAKCSYDFSGLKKNFPENDGWDSSSKALKKTIVSAN
jgi:hypothetical protein